MREALQTTLVPRLPAPCHVATQGLPASARLRGSAPASTGSPSGVCRRRNTAAALRARRARGDAAHRCRAAPTASVAHGRPSGRRGLIANHPARAVCCDALCRLARSLNQALRAQSPRPASQSSPAPRPAPAVASASLSPPREALPLQFALSSRAASSRVCRHRATPTVSPAARLRRELARALCDRHHRCTMRSHGSPESSPESNTRMKELAKYSAHANTFHRALPGQLF
jgi:hypothetical protein